MTWTAVGLLRPAIVRAGVPNRDPTWPPAASTTGGMSVGISVTTWGARHHGNTAVADDSVLVLPLSNPIQARHHGNTGPPPLL